MSVADTVTAFADMIAAGAGVEDVAVCFGITPLTVQRRLKLAKVSPSLFELFRQDKINLDQLMALAITDDHAERLPHRCRTAAAACHRAADGEGRNPQI